jgi:hypothetical protein
VRAYIAGMNDFAYWTTKLQEAERELEAATRRSAVNAAARRLMLAKAGLKRLEPPRTAHSRGSRSAGDFR